MLKRCRPVKYFTTANMKRIKPHFESSSASAVAGFFRLPISRVPSSAPYHYPPLSRNGLIHLYLSFCRGRGRSVEQQFHPPRQLFPQESHSFFPGWLVVLKATETEQRLMPPSQVAAVYLILWPESPLRSSHFNCSPMLILLYHHHRFFVCVINFDVKQMSGN